MAFTSFPDGYPIPHGRANELGLVVRLEYDHEGWAIYKDSERIAQGVMNIPAWLDAYAEQHAK